MLSSEYSAPYFFIPSGIHPQSLELLSCLFLFVAVFAFWLTPGGFAWALSRARARTQPGTWAIPGPSGLPVLGLVRAFTSSLTHRLLHNLSKTLKAESLMSFSVGFTRFVISSSPDTAREILNTSAFANRPVKESAYGLLFHRAMGFAPYGEYWRNLRRISAAHLFSPMRVSSFGEFRRETGLRMVREIGFQMGARNEVGVKRVLHFGSLNNVMMTVFGKSYDFYSDNDGGGEGAAELAGLVREGYELLGIFNWSDHFPILGWMDLQGVRKRSRELVRRVDSFVGNIIGDHRRRLKRNDDAKNDEDQHSHDFVDVLLDLDKDDKNSLSDADMIAVLWEMIFRGTDTVAILLEWILARMILHPDIQAKAQDEIDSVVGGNRTVSDSDLPNLPYLHAIVKETLRVHPPGPLLSWARLAIEDTFIGPHFIPAGTTAMVNMWAITHDEMVWTKPDLFRPERFLDNDIAIMGSDLRLAPFGSGRRVCPGKTMGLATIQLWLAQLLHSFKWVASDHYPVDLTECLKLSMEMKNPLVCRALPRTS